MLISSFLASSQLFPINSSIRDRSDRVRARMRGRNCTGDGVCCENDACLVAVVTEEAEAVTSGTSEEEESAKDDPIRSYTFRREVIASYNYIYVPGS